MARTTSRSDLAVAAAAWMDVPTSNRRWGLAYTRGTRFAAEDITACEAAEEEEELLAPSSGAGCSNSENTVAG